HVGQRRRNLTTRCNTYATVPGAVSGDNKLAPADGRTSGLEDVTKERALQAIGRVPTGVAAFVGRTLKGPVNRPVAISSFSDFQHIFGGLWQPAPVSYAVDHF